MKTFRIIFVSLFLLISSVISACEITCTIQNQQDNYSVGDELVVLVDVQLVHRSCPVAMKQTKFDYSGVKILGATKWKELSSMHYTRKLKVKVTDTSKKHMITVVRSCNKEGGEGSILIPVK